MPIAPTARKLREVLISFWLEAWLTKDQILSRYLSNVYFGDNVLWPAPPRPNIISTASPRT